MNREQECLNQMRDIYRQFSGEEVSWSIKVIRAELTAEELRHELQREILAKQQKLEQMR